MNFYKIARAVLFRLDAERAHHLTLTGLRIAERLGATYFFRPKSSTESVQVMGLSFPNRIGLAAGLDKFGNCVAGFGSIGFGFVEVGTITPSPQDGNPKPRLFRIHDHQAIINRMGFNNPGIEIALENITRSRKGFEGVLGINIGKNKDTPYANATEDYLNCFRKAYTSADYIAINISSPNTPELRKLQDPKAAKKLLQTLKVEQAKLHEETGKRVPLAVKIDPDMDTVQITALAELFGELQMDAVIATNTTVSRESVKGAPLCEESGGLSGVPLAKHSTEVIGKLYETLGDDIPIIGAGGISSAKDAEEKFAAGAKLLQVYTGLIYQGPALIRELLKVKT